MRRTAAIGLMIAGLTLATAAPAMADGPAEPWQPKACMGDYVSDTVQYLNEEPGPGRGDDPHFIRIRVAKGHNCQPGDPNPQPGGTPRP